MPPLLGLPSITPELKSISPYLQRADELKSQDPIIAYWCAYYAAQVGIALKAKDTPSRDFLFALLGTLERLKKEIGPNDAVDLESASSAYVENFALKVFSMADNEDRRGNSNRSTAKKFLAAANFLEVLKIFPKSEVLESSEEKIRYAKWKAADIAKAFREGRKPTPGPASAPSEPDLTPPGSPSRPTNTRRSSPPRASGSGSPPQIKRVSPPTHVDIPRANQPHHQPHYQPQPQTPPKIHLDSHSYPHTNGWGGEGEATPGSWSTAATPGTAVHDSTTWDQGSPTRTRHDHKEKKRGKKPRSGSGSSTESAGSKGSNGSTSKGVLKKKKAWVSEELDPHSANQHYHSNVGLGANTPDSGATNSSDGSKKSVHFTPSVVGGTSSTSGTPPISPIYDEPAHIDDSAPQVGTSIPLPPPPQHGMDLGISLPPGFVPDPNQWGTGSSPVTQISPPSPPNFNSSIYHPPPQAPSHTVQAPQPTLPPVRGIYAPPPAQPSPPTFELTPSVIAKAQKHCRFAISALDYEDAEQARKELRAALAVLGG